MPDRAPSPGAGPFAGVMQIYSGNRYGGIESMLSTMAKSPAFAGQSYGLYYRGRLYDELSASGADVVDVGPFRASRPWQAVLLRKRLTRALEERGIHTVVANMSICHALVAPIVGDRLLVYFAHECHRGSHWTERWAKLARQPDAVVTGSACVAETTRTMFPSVEPFVVHYAAALGSTFDAAIRARVREELGTPAEHKVLVTAARLVPYKGHHVLVQALSLLNARTDWTFWFAGGPQSDLEREYFAALRRSAREGGVGERVRFLGERKDVPRLLRAADVFCQANVEPEPFGICFAEALDAGIPVVTSGFGGAVEIVTPELGELVPPGDARALAAALERVMDDGDKALFTREHGPAQARAICAPEHVAANFQRAFGCARSEVRK